MIGGPVTFVSLPAFPRKRFFKETALQEEWVNPISLLGSWTIGGMIFWLAVAVSFSRYLCNSSFIVYFEYLVRKEYYPLIM